MTIVGYLAGTNEPQGIGSPRGLLRAVAAQLGAGYRNEQIPYPASFGHPMDYAHSVGWGEQVTRKWVLQMREIYPGELIWLVGFSQGAVVAGNVAAAWGRELGIHGVVLLGDGMRARHEYERPSGWAPLTGWGMAGERPLEGLVPRVHQLAIPQDPIANASPDSLWRDASDLIEYMSVTDAVGWVRQVEKRIVAHDWQNEHLTRWDQLLASIGRIPARVATANTELGGYLRVHPTYDRRWWPGAAYPYTTHAARLIDRG